VLSEAACDRGVFYFFAFIFSETAR
jgi:hypothetical protein